MYSCLFHRHTLTYWRVSFVASGNNIMICTIGFFCGLCTLTLVYPIILQFIREGLTIQKKLEELIQSKGGKVPNLDPVAIGDTDTASLEEFGYTVSVPKLKDCMGNDDCFSLVEIGTYGAKGLLDTVLAFHVA